MTVNAYRLGIGAIVSFQCKFIHPHRHRDANFPDPDVGQRLTNARVVRRALKKIKQQPTVCVIVHHEEFKGDDGNYREIWCSESHVRVDEEGDPDMVFAEYGTERETETNGHNNSYKNRAIEHTERETETNDHNNSDKNRAIEKADQYTEDESLDKGNIQDDSKEKKTDQPLATVGEVFSFARSSKAKRNLAIGLFASALSGAIQPGEILHVSFHDQR